MDFRSQITQIGVPVVTTDRTLTVSAPLTGGGDLSADRTLGLSLDATLLVSNGALGVSSLVALAAHTHTPAALGAEPALGNPGVNGYVLTSTTGGVRSWAAPTVAWGGVTDKPTSLTGYGITDALPLSGGTLTGNVTFSDYSEGIVGAYDAAKTRAIFAMGALYVLPSAPSGGTYGSFYGLAYSYNPDYAGAGNNPQSKAGLGHQVLLMQGGVTTVALGSGIWTSGAITATGATLGGYTALHAGNYNSYAPTLTGGGASGTWGVNISGTATNASYAQYLWSESHPGSYYIKANWTGTYWNLSSNHGAPVSCGYAGNAGTLGGLGLSGGGSPGANQIIRTQDNAYTYLWYINSSTAANENPPIGQVIVTNTGDSAFYRKASIAHLTAYVQANASGTWNINVAGTAAGLSSTGGITASCSFFTVNNRHYIGDDVKFAGHFAVGSPQAYPNVRIHTTIEGDWSYYYGLIINNSTNSVNRLYVRGDNYFAISGTWANLSDRRVKQDIIPEPETLSRIMQLNPVTYRFIEDVEHDGDAARTRHGFIAQDMQEVFPAIVTEDKEPNGDVRLSLTYTDLIAPLVSAVQEINRRVDATNRAFDVTVQDLNQRIAQLEAR